MATKIFYQRTGWKMKKIYEPLKALIIIISSIILFAAFLFFSDQLNINLNPILKFAAFITLSVAVTSYIYKTFRKKINASKDEQNGDYFLTSLLIDPLLCNNVKSKNIKVDFLIKQKKQFHFRKRDGQIGGDACIAHSIELMGKPFTVFLNGDAMGKSLQGAGGALVLGVVFNTFVERMKSLRAGRGSYPEKWLKSCYEELQSIFTSFEGTMIVSVVVGIVDDETGLLYYFNAEHPWNVLYRKGQAHFMEDSTAMRKIGISGLDDGLKVNIFQLRPGDILIAGSDGRDDLLTGHTGIQRIINEDEKLFLEKVEKAESNLELIHKELLKSGELTDDLSLLRLSYLENYDQEEEKQKKLQFLEFEKKSLQAYEEKRYNDFIAYSKKALMYQKDKTCFERLIAFYQKEELINEEAKTLDQAMRYFPIHFNFLSRAAVVYKKLRRYELAADFGERYNTHCPDDIENLFTLADIYRLRENFMRAKQILSIIGEKQPEHPQYQFFKDLIENKSLIF